MTEEKPVAGYFRISRARDDMKAPELYRDELERYCRYKRLQLAVFSDIDVSARRGAKVGAGMQALIASRQRFAAVVIPELSRFGRSMTHLMQLFDLFEAGGTPLVFLDLGIDTSTSQGPLLRNVMAAFAECERDVRSDYSRASRDHRARQGLPHGGWAPFGYTPAKDTHVVDQEHARIVRDIFAMYERGESMTGVARVLNERGIPSCQKGLWSKPTIRKILENHHYAGLRRCGDELVPGRWHPIFSARTFEAVQARLQAITNRGVRPGAGLYLLSGLIECGVCGMTL